MWKYVAGYCIAFVINKYKVGFDKKGLYYIK